MGNRLSGVKPWRARHRPALLLPGAGHMAQLKDLVVEWVSLVKHPANGKGLVLKSGGPALARPVALTKFDDEWMRAYGIVYAPDQVDSQGDWADAATIRQAAARFMREGRTGHVDREHDYAQSGHFIAESWITRTQDPLFPTEGAGAWAVGIQVTDPIEWAALKNGDRVGLSLAGYAREIPDQTGQSEPKGTHKTGPDGDGWINRIIKALQGLVNNVEQDDMTEDQVKSIAQSCAEAAVTAALSKFQAAGGDAGKQEPGQNQAAAQSDQTNGEGDKQEPGQNQAAAKSDPTNGKAPESDPAADAGAALAAQVGELAKALEQLRGDIATLAKRGAREGGGGDGAEDLGGCGLL